jgi:prepilin-type N-terminal cleavage/methylation domain-containing protein
MKRISNRAGFTLIELMAVVVILAILAGVALPKFFDYQAQAKVASTKGTIGGVRAGIASFYADAAISGTPAYPTLTELTDGSVMQESLPENPYDADNDVSTATAAEQAARTAAAGESGWKYFVDNVGPARSALFYANSNSTGENAW